MKSKAGEGVAAIAEQSEEDQLKLQLLQKIRNEMAGQLFTKK
jgi:hypothetical protein